MSEEAKITRRTKRDPHAATVEYPHARGVLHIAKADGSETLVIDRVSISPAKGGAKCASLTDFDALEQHKPSRDAEGNRVAPWPNGFGLLVSPSSYRSLRKDCDPVAAPALNRSAPDADAEG